MSNQRVIGTAQRKWKPGIPDRIFWFLISQIVLVSGAVAWWAVVGPHNSQASRDDRGKTKSCGRPRFDSLVGYHGIAKSSRIIVVWTVGQCWRISWRDCIRCASSAQVLIHSNLAGLQGLHIATVYKFVKTIMIASKRNERTKEKYMWLSCIGVLFALGTINISCIVHFNELAWIDMRTYPGGPVAFLLERSSEPSNVGSIATESLSQTISGLVMVSLLCFPAEACTSDIVIIHRYTAAMLSGESLQSPSFCARYCSLQQVSER